MKDIELSIATLIFIFFFMINFALFTEVLNPFFLFLIVVYFVFFEVMGLREIKTSFKELIIFGTLLLYWIVSFPFYVLLETLWGWVIFILFPTIVYLAFYKRDKELYLFTIILTILFSFAHFIVLGQFYADIHLFFLPIMFFLVLVGLYYYFTNWPSKSIKKVRTVKKIRKKKK